MSRFPLSSMMEEVIAPHREFGIKVELVERNGHAGEPTLHRNAGIMYGLGNLIENAVDYARDKVTVTTTYDSETLTILVEDDGTGYAADILTRIGEPYVTTRQRDDTAGGLGLGLFIAKTLLERSGARLTFGNRDSGAAGARIRIEWPRLLIDSGSTK